MSTETAARTALALLLAATALSAAVGPVRAAEETAAQARATPPALEQARTTRAAGLGSGSVQVELSELVARARAAIPDGWEIVEAEAGETPIGWSGESSGLLVMAEDTRTRFFHPNGFHYYSFYRVWLMPSNWEGVMRHTPYVSDSVPAYLLGANEDYVAFYHTAGGNVWPEGPEKLCDALGLDRICYTDLTRRVVDMDIEKKLTRAPSESGFELNPKRIVGLLGSGCHVYMEYVFPERESTDESKLLSTLTDELAGSVFERIPEAESLYLRRCTIDSYTDTIVTRS